jgi:2-polyprenyl-3-methyl-5-hydroxy-6-metoxy-1,4-benzoquinol methylase
MHSLISRRYRDDAKESFHLTERQIFARDTIRKKFQNNIYKTQEVNCPCCDAKDYKVLSKKDTYGLNTQVVLCTCCGLIYNNPRISDMSLLSFYDQEYKALDRVLPAIENYCQMEIEKGKAIEKFIEENGLFKKKKDKVVIEIGCGAGGVLKHFSEKGFRALGCDLSSENVDFACKVLSLQVYHGDIGLIEKVVREEKIKVDLIIYEQVFEHLPNPKEELNKLIGIMNDSSLLYIAVPGLRNIGNHYQSNFLRYLQLPHLLNFDLQSLSNLLGEKGFSLIAGNEIVQAVFKLGKETIPCKNGSNDILRFLYKLEKNYQRERLFNFLKYLPLNILLWSGRNTKKILLNSSFLSPKIKAKISKIILSIRSKLP